MFIYDSTSIAFIHKSEQMLREILQEIGITVRRSRFVWRNYLYPINVVVFDKSAEWGHYNTAYMQIGLNRKLIYLAKDSVVRDILRHELAHYLTAIEFGPVQSHGKEFKEVCERYGFPANVAEATMSLEFSNESKEGDLVSERVIEKVKKLLQLAQSSNMHEAELATIKANELLLRHHLDHTSCQKQEALYMDRVLFRNRKDAKLVAIYDILKHFIVRPVLSMGRNTCSLEVSGSLTNVTLAQYVATFLDRELDHMWEAAKAEHGLQGLRSKNSFFTGVAKGFEEKMKAVKTRMPETDQKALLVVEKKLTTDVSQIYRRLSSSGSGATVDGHARDVGVEKGKTLNIRKGVESSGGKSLYLPS